MYQSAEVSTHERESVADRSMAGRAAVLRAQLCPASFRRSTPDCSRPPRSNLVVKLAEQRSKRFGLPTSQSSAARRKKENMEAGDAGQDFQGACSSGSCAVVMTPAKHYTSQNLTNNTLLARCLHAGSRLSGGWQRRGWRGRARPEGGSGRQGPSLGDQ